MDRYAKAIVGALLAGLGALQVALLQDGITAYEWTGVLIVFLATLGGVWAVPNRPSDEDLELYQTRKMMRRVDRNGTA